MESDLKYDGLSPVRPLALPADMTEIKLEILRLRDEVIGLRARLAEAEIVIKQKIETEALKSNISPEEHVEYLKGVVDDLEARLAATRSSTTWRIGRTIVAPMAPLRRFSGRR